MEREMLASGAQSTSVDAARGRRVWLPILLVVAGVATAAGTAVHPRAAATIGSAALLSGGAVVALRRRRRSPEAGRAERRSPEALLVGGARAALTTPDPDGALGALLEALAAALDAGVAFQGSGASGRAPITVTGGAAGADVGDPGPPVPESMRTAEPTVLAGSAAGEAGGLPGALAAGAALSVPVRAAGELAGWLTAARPGARAVPFTPEEIALAAAAAAVAGAVLAGERLRREAHAGAQARSDFLAVMSHELKTPLNVVVGYADLLLMGLPEAVPEGARRNVERLRRSARELQERIEDILAYVRLADGTELGDEEPVEVDVGAVLREVAGQLEPLARGRSLRYTVRTPATRLALRTYPDALARLLRLVLSNAVKFTYAGGIEATAAAAPGGVVIRVLDTGVGIAADQLAQAFEPFWQAQRGATRREGGLGLGLTTARAITRALGGEIRLESIPGTGTTVTLTLADRP